MENIGLVTIVMPSYNTGRFIEETIESVLNQTYSYWELIIVDDCSNDNTYEVLKRFLYDDRIKLIKNEKNSGAAVSRNRALQCAQGRWIAFLDSDDIWVPEKLEKQLNFMISNNYHFSYSKYEEIDEDSNSRGVVVSGPKRITKHGMYSYCWPGCLTVMYDRNQVGDIQICDIKKNNDYAMWLQVAKKADCFLIDTVLAKYRKRNGSISNHSYVNLIKWHYKLFRESEIKSSFISVLYTIRNLFFGSIKKIVYVKKEVR